MQGEDLERLELRSPADIPSKMPLTGKCGADVKLKASMLQDLEKGRDCEINYINGVISITAANAAWRIPFNDKIVNLVTEAQNRRRVNDFGY